MSHCTSCATAFVLDSTDVSIGRRAPFPPGAYACVHRQLGDGAWLLDCSIIEGSVAGMVGRDIYVEFAVTAFVVCLRYVFDMSSISYRVVLCGVRG